MNLTALIYVLSGSLLHVGWNVLAKQSKDKLAFIWLSLLPLSIAGCTYSILVGIELNSIAITCIAASGLIHAIYFYFLTQSYELADLSFVYPYCRGVGSLGAVMGGLFLLSESPSTLGICGITVSLVGMMIEPLSQFKKVKTSLTPKAITLTILTGLCIAGYLLIDKIGIEQVHPALYMSLFTSSAVIFMFPFMMKKKRIIEELKSSRHRFLISCFFLGSAYILVLYAMELAPVSYVTAARATGIIVSTLTGIFWFKESVSKARWVSVILVTLGVYLIGIS